MSANAEDTVRLNSVPSTVLGLQPLGFGEFGIYNVFVGAFLLLAGIAIRRTGSGSWLLVHAATKCLHLLVQCIGRRLDAVKIAFFDGLAQPLYLFLGLFLGIFRQTIREIAQDLFSGEDGAVC